MKKLQVLLIVIIMLFSLASCEKPNDVEDKKYSVTFVENGGTEVEDIQNIEKGTNIVLPSISRVGYSFDGWYTSKKFISGTEVTNETKIGKNLNLYAKWVALTFDVNFSLDGGTMESEYQDGNNKVDYGTEINLPMPIKTGYLFDGWYINDSKVEGSFVITDDVNITTKWIDINTLQKSYQLTLNLDGGLLYDYNSKEELMEHFFVDYSKFMNMAIDSTNFWNMSYNSIIGERGFFGNSVYADKWRFFVEYLSTTAREENRQHIVRFLNGEQMDREQSEMTRTVLRNEILAFFLNTERVVPGWGSLISGNYANEELQNGYLAYCQSEIPTSYVTGEGITLREPLKEGYVFLGWYATNDFTGKTYTEVEVNEYGEKVFYALWGQV